MPALIQRRNATLAWLAILAMLSQAVPSSASLRPAGDPRGHLICSSAAPEPGEARQGGSTPSKHDSALHDCAHCVPATAPIGMTPRPEFPALAAAAVIAGATGEGVAPRPTAALPPPPCGPPSLPC